VRDSKSIAVLKSIPHHHELVRANRFLLLLASILMVITFVMGFLLLPVTNAMDGIIIKEQRVATNYALQNPVLSTEINALKGQLVGLISGSIESKLRVLEKSIQSGQVNTSLGTIQDLKNDVKVLQAYSVPKKNVSDHQVNEVLLKEVSQLKRLIYFTLTSCGLMIAAVGGFWVRRYYHLEGPGLIQKIIKG